MKRASVVGLVLALGAVWPGCSLGNIHHDDCNSSTECAGLFGLGSACTDGFCGEPSPCVTDADCRAAFGFGASCKASACKAVAKDPRCTQTEPKDLLSRLGKPDAKEILVGAIFKLGTEKEQARANAAKLAIREINDEGGGIEGKHLGLVVCSDDPDKDGSGNDVAGTDATKTKELATYLGGGLGVRLIIGPSSSANTTAAIGQLLQGKLASVVISPSATSSTITDQPDKFDPKQPFGLLWRTCPSDALQGGVLAARVALLGLPQGSRAVVLYQQDAYGQSLELAFRTSLMTAAPDLTVDSTPFAIDESDLDAAIATASASAADVLLVVNGDAKRTVDVLEKASATALSTAKLYLTDGSKDAAGLLTAVPMPVKTMLQGAEGTAPASPSGLAYDTFKNNLKSAFGTDASSFSFLAQTYDATYVGVFGLVYASRTHKPYDGFEVAAGLSRLATGAQVDIGPTGFTKGANALLANQSINVRGTSGPLDFDASTGEAPGPIEVWKVNATFDGFSTVTTVNP